LNIRLIFLLLIVVLNFGFAALQLGLLRRRRPWPANIGVAVFAWAALMSGLGLLMIIAPFSWRSTLRDWFYFPMAVQMIWNLLFIQLLFLGGILVTIIWGRARRVDRAVAPTPQDISRRKFVYLVACGAAPAAAIGMGVHGTLTRHDLRVRDLRVPITGLPPELEGFTIAHVSDLHSGIFCGPERLEKIRECANDLKADLIVVTGDIINSDMAEFPVALKAIQEMESRLGTFLCEGNHDLIPGANLFRSACAENQLALLYNSSVTLPVRGRNLILGGLPWYRSGFQGHTEAVNRLYPQRSEGDVRILLAHHPDLFDIADSADLVLSGHTHGGQIMVGPLGFGPLFFKYWSGLYRRNQSTMVVSNGAGDWFPCRIGAPAEVGRLTLTRAV
jgi:predicted MPP superfamily phosphohydrolase